VGTSNIWSKNRMGHLIKEGSPLLCVENHAWWRVSLIHPDICVSVVFAHKKIYSVKELFILNYCMS
jgi:hypothetical protein